MATQASGHHTPVVLVTIGLLKVNFADGATWSDDEAINSETLDHGRAGKETKCHSPTLKTLQGKRS